MTTLHYAPRTISIVVMLALDEVGADYDTVLVDFSKSEQTGMAYKAVNAKGRVPALEVPGGILTETPAILEFVAPTLVPPDAFDAARMRETISYLACTMHVNHAHRIRGYRWADEQSSFDDMARKVPETIAASCAYLEAHLALTPFAGGAEMTLADLYLYPILTWVPGDGVDLAAYPKLSAFAAMMAKRPSVRKATKLGLL